MIAIGTPGPIELTLIGLAVLILFGAKRLPELARGLGKGIREFKTALTETQEQIKSGMESGSDSAEKKDAS
ncbi:MAG: twin-arginine translocase TatA/TatE family subunit [candidate division Zixibacteria bacterium]|nr:twin-arginine translocase TatA/TatE family subunit [candidate division Zixibacteria bacterium]